MSRAYPPGSSIFFKLDCQHGKICNLGCAVDLDTAHVLKSSQGLHQDGSLFWRSSPCTWFGQPKICVTWLALQPCEEVSNKRMPTPVRASTNYVGKVQHIQSDVLATKRP